VSCVSWNRRTYPFFKRNGTGRILPSPSQASRESRHPNTSALIVVALLTYDAPRLGQRRNHFRCHLPPYRHCPPYSIGTALPVISASSIASRSHGADFQLGFTVSVASQSSIIAADRNIAHGFGFYPGPQYRAPFHALAGRDRDCRHIAGRDHARPPMRPPPKIREISPNMFSITINPDPTASSPSSLPWHPHKNDCLEICGWRDATSSNTCGKNAIEVNTFCFIHACDKRRQVPTILRVLRRSASRNENSVTRAVPARVICIVS